jgi:hypothetical protein
MKLRLLPLLLAAVFGSGCIVQHDATQPGDPLSSTLNNGGGGYANITFAWSFDGRSCAQASVETVVITMPGEQLQNAGRFACSSGTQDGITLTNFYPGSYPYTVQAYGAAGDLLYQASGEIQVGEADKLEQVALSSAIDGGSPGGVHGIPPPGTHDGTDGGPTGGDLDGGGAPVDGGSADAGPDGGSATYRYYLSWTFPDVPNAPVCGGELTQVVVTIDGAATTYDCTAGLSPAQIATPALTLGNHSLQLDAVGADGTVWASKQISLGVTCGCHPNQTYELPWVVGSAAVDWIFFDAAHQNPTTSCDVALVDSLSVNFQGMDGSWLFSDDHGNQSDDTFSCVDSGGLAVYRALPPGTYSVLLAGSGSCGNYAEYPGQACYQVTVTAGVFLTRESSAGSVVSIDLDHE